MYRGIKQKKTQSVLINVVFKNAERKGVTCIQQLCNHSRTEVNVAA